MTPPGPKSRRRRLVRNAVSLPLFVTATVVGYGCPESASTCGDGIVEGAEECDDAELNDDAGQCKTDCTLQVCGDGHVGPGERCDPAAEDAQVECTDACILATCGDGIVAGAETCDDPQNPDCNSACRLIGVRPGSGPGRRPRLFLRPRSG